MFRNSPGLHSVAEIQKVKYFKLEGQKRDYNLSLSRTINNSTVPLYFEKKNLQTATFPHNYQN